MKWPKTWHVPDSPGITRDDRVLENIDHLKNREIVITEKLDGETFSLYYNHLHARSQDYPHHESQNWLKAFHARFKYLIPAHWQIAGEYLYAQHTICYDELTSYFYVFAIIDNKLQMVFSLDETLLICQSLGLVYVPILYRGLLPDKFIMPKKSVFGQEIEGYVVRPTGEFPVSEIYKNMAKYVRADHVKTDKHWRTNWVPNKLKNI